MRPSSEISDLLAIMRRLRTPVTGCPWDLAQDFASIAPYTIEEAYEVADAIARHDLDDLKDELGDLLLQVVFHAQMADEAGGFAFPDVVAAITTKLIRRHPHVFLDSSAGDPESAKADWESIKVEEKAERAASRGEGERPPSILDGIPRALPALTRAVKLQRRAGTVGFDWNDPHAVLAKIREELGELEDELSIDAPAQERLEDELGDLLFAAANLARHLHCDPETALRRSMRKFEGRFGHVEQQIKKSGRTLEGTSLAEMEAFWGEAKRLETGG